MGPNTLIKQGAKLTATWEDVWEDLPSNVRVELESRRVEEPGMNPSGVVTASLFHDVELRPQERLVFRCAEA